MILLGSLAQFLRARYGRPCLLIGTGHWNEPVARGNPDIERVWTLARHRPCVLDSAWWRLVPVLKRSAPGPIYVCEDTKLPRVQRLLKLSGVDPRRCAFITEEPAHPEEHYLELLRRFGERTPETVLHMGGARAYPPPTTMQGPRLTVMPLERKERDAWIYARGWHGRQIILVQVGNRRTMAAQRERYRRFNRDDKAWPVARWGALLRQVHLRMPDAVIILCGTAQELALLRRIQAVAALPAVAACQLGLRQLFALCELAHSMISVDSGPAHAAAALGVPLVVMFGSASPRRWLARSPGSPVIQVGGPPVSSHINQIPVEAVLEAWCMLPGTRSGTVAVPTERWPSSPPLVSAPRPLTLSLPIADAQEPAP
jgi:ADP-heptose:LPS heptosyltransferase